MKNMFRTLQIIWLIAAVGALIGAVINAFNNKLARSRYFCGHHLYWRIHVWCK